MTLTVNAVAQSVVTLDEIQVTGQSGTGGLQPGLASLEAARGPINGYVAISSASATKTATPIVETPQAISVIGARQIRDQDIETLDQALNYTPGVRGQTFGIDYRNDWFLLRGFSAQEAGYFLDGLQLFSFGFSTFQIEPWGLERIEVLRGPTASLYGGGNPGGIINAVSKLPTFTNFGLVQVGINEFGNAYSAFDIGGVAGERNEWSYRVAALGRAGGTQIDFTDFNRAFIAPSLSYRPDGATTFTVLGQYTNTTTSGQNFLPYEGTVTRAPYGRLSNRLFSSDPNLDRFERNQALIGYQFEHAPDNQTILRQNFRFSTVDVNLRQLYGTSYVDGEPTVTTGVINRGNFRAHDAAFIINIDNNIERRFVTGPLAHVALAGLDFKHYGQNQNDGFDVGSTLDLVNPVYGQQPPVLSRYSVARTSFDQLGLYVQDQIKYDRLTILLGLRYDLLNSSLNNKLPGSLDYEKQTGKFSGRIGAIYNLELGFAPYVSYSTSFNPVIGTNAASTLFRPETGEQYEVGLKYLSPTMPLSASIALFDLTRSNVPVTDPNNVFLQVQTGEQNSRGIEAEVTATLTDGLSLIGAYTTYNLKVTRDTVLANIGTTPTSIPEQFASLWLDYTIPTGTYRGFGIGAGIRYVGNSFANAENNLRVPEVYVGDLLVHYDSGPWRAALNITNFTDEKYVASCALATSCYYAERRRTTVSLAYRW